MKTTFRKSAQVNTSIDNTVDSTSTVIESVINTVSNDLSNKLTSDPSTGGFEQISREELILRRLFDDTKVQSKVIQHLDPDLFTEPAIKILCKAIGEGFKKYNRFVQANEIQLALQSNSEEVKKLVRIMNLKVDAIDSNMAVDVIESFFKEKMTEKILVDCAEAINQRDFKNISAMVKDLEQSVTFSLHMDIGLNLVNDTEEALRLLNETHKAIPSSLDFLNEKTSDDGVNGGWYKSALSVFQGMPNVGKTILLCNEAAYAYQCGYNVLYVTLEMGKEHIWKRMASNITNIPLYKIAKESPETIIELLKENKERGSEKCGNLLVKEMPTSLTPQELEVLINEIKITEGYSVDLVVLDYIQLMKPNKGSAFGKNQSLYTMGDEVSKQVRDLAKKIEVAILSASQVNREGYDNNQGSMKNTAGSAGLNNNVDLMITIQQDPYLKEFKMFLHTIIKNRFGQKDDSFMSDCAYEFMRVRCSRDENIEQYRQTQVNQDIKVANFNSKSREPETKEEKTEREYNRLKAINEKLAAKNGEK